MIRGKSRVNASSSASSHESRLRRNLQDMPAVGLGLLFNAIGETYTQTRKADGRIVARLVKYLGLPPGAILADIGAGTGNYSVALAEAGYHVRATEPSSAMRQRARPHPRVEWIEGCAERIPLPDKSVDGVVSTLAVCHCSDAHQAMREMARIARTGAVAIFTFDCEAGKHTWLYEYFPFLWDAFDQSPSPQQLAETLGKATGCPTKVRPFPLPPDLQDHFAAAAWRCPQRYLDECYRANISSFRKTNPNTVAECVERLARDLADGGWARRYGTVMGLEELDAGYRFIVSGGKAAGTNPSAAGLDEASRAD